MANPTPKSNTKITEPRLSDLMNLLQTNIFLSLNCHAIATVQSFDDATQTISATINYKKSYETVANDGSTKLTFKDYPILIDVPVIILGGGAANLTFPIAKGDECLILFNDRDIDNWFQSGQITGPASGRLHSFADGVALVGLNSMANVITSYDTTRAKLFYGSTMVGVSASKVKIANSLYTLNGLLQDLISALTSNASTFIAVTGTTGAASPLNPAIVSALTAVSTHLGALLE